MKTIVKMLIVLSVIGIVSGGALSRVDNWARPKIAEHRKKATEEAIFLVQPQAKNYEKVEADFDLYKVMDENGNHIGYSMPYEGNGFQGKIRLMFGISADLEQIVGLQILEHAETPGIGTKIEEPVFDEQFDDLSATPNINPVKGAPASQPNDVETITGATITSKAVIAIVNSGVDKIREFNKQGGA
jgi:electron transport complex protein RnfG